MRRLRKEATKVWHNPEIMVGPRRGSDAGMPARRSAEQHSQDRRVAKEHRAALEALFTPRRTAQEIEEQADAKSLANAKAAGRSIVLAPPPQSDPAAVERQRLLSKLLSAEGRPAISKAADEFAKAGFTLPQEQDVYLQLLEHADEDRVREAIETLSDILAGELPKRRAVLESRLRRIEQFAEESKTRDAAERLRKQVNGRPDASNSSNLV